MNELEIAFEEMVACRAYFMQSLTYALHTRFPSDAVNLAKAGVKAECAEAVYVAMKRRTMA